MIELAEESWTARKRGHEDRVQIWTRGVLERRPVGRHDPIDDFLFSYYSLSPAQLSRWHPGVLTLLLGHKADQYLRLEGYRRCGAGVAVDPVRFAHRLRSAEWIRTLLTQTQRRRATFNCFGLHEWAMVYHAEKHQRRHTQLPLRLSDHDIERVVESQPLHCTHFDAFRFFTPSAQPLNVVQLERQDQLALEQPGCLHVNMDLYKWAYKLNPLTSSDLVADCFELARDVREVDMRASPYDLTEFGHTPIKVESTEGRHEYVGHQRRFSERGHELRQRVLDEVNVVVEELSRRKGADTELDASSRASTSSRR